MGDSWEDEEFEVPVIVPVVSSTKNWDDEDETLKEQSKPPPAPSAAQLELAKKRAEEEAFRLAQKLEFALEENETPDERKLRERRKVEEEDAKLAGELFDGVDRIDESVDPSPAKPVKQNAPTIGVSLTAGVAGVKLKTKDDHVNFAVTVATKLHDSTSFNTTAFFKELTGRTKGSLTVESLTDIIDSLTLIRDAKKKEEISKGVATVKKSKKDIKHEEKKHAEKYGFSEDPITTRYESYSRLEDDFM